MLPKSRLKSFNPEKHNLLQFVRQVGGISAKKSNLAAEIIVRETKEGNYYYYYDHTVIKKGVGESGDPLQKAEALPAKYHPLMIIYPQAKKKAREA